MITIEIAYAPNATTHERESLQIAQGSRACDAIAQSQLVKRYPEIAKLPIGVFGVRVEADYELCADDRIEVYRPLSIDPMQKRKNRANLKRG